MKHPVLTSALLAIATTSSLQAITLTGYDFTDVELFSGTATEVGSVYRYSNIGSDTASGRQVDAFLTITESTVTNIRSVLEDGRVGFAFDNRFDASEEAFITTTLNFEFSDNSSDATISNLIAFTTDVDSSDPTSSNPIYSDVIGIASGQVSQFLLSETTQLVRNDDFAEGFISGSLGDLNDGNHFDGDPARTTSFSDNLLDYSADFVLEERSSYDIIFGVTGPDSDERSNRINGVQFGDSISVPEPSSMILTALGFFTFILRRKR